MRLLSATLLGPLAAVLTVGCSGDAATQHAAYERNSERTRAALVTAGDPDSLLAVALFGGMWGDEPAERLALIRRAARAAPDRPDLAWWQLELCLHVRNCDPRPIEERLRTLDPANAAAWAGSLARLDELGDAAAVQGVIESMAGAGRFDTYWNATVVHAAGALIRSRTMDPAAALVATIGVSAAQTLPLQPITRACGAAGLQRPEVLESCRRLSVILQHGDTYLLQMAGLSLAKRTWPTDSPEYRAAAQARRVLAARLEAVSTANARTPWDNPGAQRYLAMLALHRTEQEASAAFFDEGASAALVPLHTASAPAAQSTSPRANAQ